MEDSYSIFPSVTLICKKVLQSNWACVPPNLANVGLLSVIRIVNTDKYLQVLICTNAFHCETTLVTVRISVRQMRQLRHRGVKPPRPVSSGARLWDWEVPRGCALNQQATCLRPVKPGQALCPRKHFQNHCILSLSWERCFAPPPQNQAAVEGHFL